MTQFKTGPGVLWLGNEGDQANQLKKAQASLLSLGEVCLVLDYLALFAHQEGGSFNCTLIQECRPSILEI
jgi:hypothetical protein